MKNSVIIGITAIICITIITVAGLALGYDNALLAGSMSGIAGVAGAFGAYNASKAKYPKWHDDRVKKEEVKHD